MSPRFHVQTFLRLALLAGVASCGGTDVLTPGEGPPSSLEFINAGTTSGFTGNFIATPSVRVRNRDGQTLSGVPVRFRVEGDGQLAWTEANSDSSGSVSPGGWRLGSAPGAQRLIAESGALSASFTVQATAPPLSSFHIDLLLDGLELDPADLEELDAAIHRWEGLVVGNLTAMRIPNDVPAECPALLLFKGRQVQNMLVILTGRGVPPGALATTVLCLRRPNGGLPLVASIGIDVEHARSVAGLKITLEHEIAHALGFGTIWSGMLREQNGDLRFVGRSAEAAYLYALGPGKGRVGQGVPVEMLGGTVVARSHWRETSLTRELLTGYSNLGDQPLSAITLGALRDLGLVVDDSRADPFVIAAAGFPVARAGKAPSWEGGRH